MNTRIRRLPLCIGLFILAAWNLSAVTITDDVSSNQSISKTYTFDNITTPVSASVYIQASASYPGWAIGTTLLIVPGTNEGTVINLNASSSGNWYVTDSVSNLVLPGNECYLMHIGSCGEFPSHTYFHSTITW